MVMGYIWVCWDHWSAQWGRQVHSGCPVYCGAPWESSGSFGVAGFIGVRTGVVGFIRGRWTYSGAPSRSLGSFAVVGCIRVRLRGHCVHAGLMGSLGCALGLVGYILCHMVHWGSPWGRRVHPESLVAHQGSSSSLEFTGLIRVRSGVFGFIHGAWVHWSAPWGSWVSFGVLGSLGCRPGVVGFIRDRWAYSGVACRSTVAVLIRVHTGGRRVHPASLGTFDCAQSVVGFIRGWVN